MGFFVKSFLILLVIAVAGGFLINQIPSWKQRVIEIVNPAAKEARLLGELKVNLDELSGALNSSAEPSSDNKSRNKDLIDKSRNLVGEIMSTNQANSGIIKQQIGKIIDAFIDRTPYPADHLKIKTSEQQSLICPPSK